MTELGAGAPSQELRAQLATTPHAMLGSIGRDQLAQTRVLHHVDGLNAHGRVCTNCEPQGCPCFKLAAIGDWGPPNKNKSDSQRLFLPERRISGAMQRNEEQWWRWTTPMEEKRLIRQQHAQEPWEDGDAGNAALDGNGGEQTIDESIRDKKLQLHLRLQKVRNEDEACQWPWWARPRSSKIERYHKLFGGRMPRKQTDGGYEQPRGIALDSAEPVAAVRARWKWMMAEIDHLKMEQAGRVPYVPVLAIMTCKLENLSHFGWFAPLSQRISQQIGKKPEDGMIADLSRVGEGSRHMHRRLQQ